MKTFLKWFLGTIAVIVILVLIILAFGIFLSINEPQNRNDDISKISIEKFGEKYPFTIDNLTLKCENDAVWVEDSALNKYALNGLADGKLQGRGDYKGYTTEIEKPNPDIPGTTLGYGNMLDIGLTLCE